LSSQARERRMQRTTHAWLIAYFQTLTHNTHVCAVTSIIHRVGATLPNASARRFFPQFTDIIHQPVLIFLSLLSYI
jgi:hypothetical protein